jgi:hypothetical protein
MNNKELKAKFLQDQVWSMLRDKSGQIGCLCDSLSDHLKIGKALTLDDVDLALLTQVLCVVCGELAIRRAEANGET